ncbi:MAG: signal recognition particle protein Srp54 [Candidatus Hadarchaeales archaeon]
MVLEKLGKALHGALQRLARAPHVDEETVRELVRDLQRALLQADVNVQLVLDLTKRLEERLKKESPPPGMSRREHAVKLVYEELSGLLGKPSSLELKKGAPTVVLMVGLQGSGKTTSVAKLAYHFKRKGFRVGVVCADTFRAGAYDQLSQLGQRAGVEVWGEPGEKDPVGLARGGVEELGRRCDLVLVDSAGRHKEERGLMEEMRRMAEAIRPDEVMLVVDGTLGQQARDQAEAFRRVTPLGSILVTKLDGTAKGGGALSAVAATGAPIKFIGTGEHLEDLEPFDPPRFMARLLGMGDLETFLRRVEETMGVKGEEGVKEALRGKLTLRTVYEQLEAMSKMGPLKKIAGLIPGLGVSLSEDQVRVGEEKLKRFRVIMQSMTPQELDNPEILNASRIRRVAKGSGTSEAEVRELLRQYELMKRMLKTLGKGRLPRGGPLGKLVRELEKEKRR